MPKDGIAIIGAAALLPGVAGLADFHDRLCDGYDAIGQPTPDRVHNTGGTPDRHYLDVGYLDRIDLFDHRFFGISLREAELMDPHQRLVLQLAHQAIENAGYATARLRGSRTAVLLTEASSDYQYLLDGVDPQQVLGVLSAATAARISYLLDLVGPALVVDTACSSGLTALAEAVRMLRDGTADLALVGGVSVQPALPTDDGWEPLRGVESATSTCRPFDEDANGTVGGEGGGVVLLKPLAAARADRDNVLCVLRGVAINHNGYRAASMGAPSQVAQAEVITAAWRDAGVAAGSIGYVECHGSATPLGDVVEVDALSRAFRQSGVDIPSCAIGSVKGNTGHLGNAAGMAGLFRAMSAVRHGALYPTAHFTTPNPLIDFTGPVWVNRVHQSWAAATPRRAGLSAFGLTGTNAHAVLEQAPAVGADDPGNGAELITVSAKTPQALADYCRLLADFADTTGHSLRAVAHVVNRGRDDHPYRFACTAAGLTELATALRAATPPSEPAAGDPAVVLLFSPDVVIDDEAWTRLCAEIPELADEQPGVPLLRQLALYRLLTDRGVADPHFVGTGAGNIAVRCAKGELSVPAALDALAGQPPAELNRQRLHQAVAGFRGSGAILVEMGTDGLLSREIRAAAPELPIVAMTGGEGRRGLLDQLGRIYTLGGTIDWERYYRTTSVARIEAPTYPFQPIRCWVDPPATEPVHTARPSVVHIPVVHTPPDGDTERHVAMVWQQVLKAPDITPDSDYFALGGTSISGISVLRRLEHDFGVALTFADIYAERTVRALAARVDRLRADGNHHDDRTITPIPRGGRLPLSFGQEQLWYLDRLNPGTPLYNIPSEMRMYGKLDIVALRGTVADLAARHEVLRTCIRSDDGEPYVHVLPEGPRLEVIDLAGLSDEDRHAEVLRLADAESVLPFDLAAGPLLRLTLLRLADDDHLLLVTYHHIIFDGWSPSVFFRDLTAIYTARHTRQPAALPALPIQFADFAAWQRSWLTGRRLTEGLDFWRAELAGLSMPELPLDRPRPEVRSFAGDLIEFTVPAELARRARTFSGQHGVTTFVTMLALVDALLHRWAGMDDIAVGVGTSGRTHPETHDLIGYFNNLPPFRTRVTGDLTFAELVGRCARTVAGALDHEEMPFEKIVAAVCRQRDAARHPLYDVAYTYQNAPPPSGGIGDLTFGRYRDGNIGGIAPGTAKFDLTFGVTDQDDGPMFAYVEYAVALFDRSTAQLLADWLPTMLTAALADPGIRIDQLPRARVADPSIVDGIRFDPWDGGLPWEAVQDYAAAHPDQLAVVSDAHTFSYREINRMANRLAGILVTAGVGIETTVPVVVPRGAELVVAWLAVAKAGGATIPIDVELPAMRIVDIVAETAPPMVIDSAWLARMGTWTPTCAADDENPPRRTGPSNVVYVAYTSGSTGRPHGCQIEHRNLTELVRWYRDEVDLAGGEQMLQITSPSFDVAIIEVWTGLCTGVTLHFLPTALEEPGRLGEWLAEHRVDVAFLPTQLAEIVLTEADWWAGPGLRLLSTGGEALRVRPRRDSPFRVLNMYGPTECTVVATAGYVSPEGTELPDIGRPIAGSSIYIVDSALQPVPAGELGEVCIGGACVGRGYRELPGFTADRFVADPCTANPGDRMYRTGDLGRLRPDGTIEFAGRIDDQVEIRGRRVEPAEIERTIASHPAVREVVVVAVTAPSGSIRLVANVATTQPAPVADDLLGWVAQRLPSYMVPSQVVLHDRLPRTGNGKLDRKGTKKMAMTSTVPKIGQETNGRAEQELVRIAGELLGLDDVRPDDDFFQIGGDSVLGVRVAARAAKAGVHFSPQQLLQHHSLRELAAACRVEQSATPTPSQQPVPTPLPVTDDRPIQLTPIMHAFFDRMPGAAAGFVVMHPMETTTHIDAGLMRAAVEHLVTRHEPLRYRFRHNSLGWRIECATPAETDVFDVRVLPPLPEADQLALVVADLSEVRPTIQLDNGPALRVRYYDRGHGSTCWLVFLMHHYVTDNMATVVLIDDLDAALGELTAGRPLAAPVPSTAWRQWSQHLHDMATSDELAGELPYWTGILQAGAATSGRPATYPAGESHAVGRRVDQVADVLRAGPAADEAAMCAFGWALGRWHDSPAAYVMTEGAATPNVYRPHDRAPAVGWFTTLHPLLLPADPDRGVRECMAAVADRIRSVPGDGVGYGILRHLTPDSPALRPLRALPEPEALVLHSTHGGTGFDSGVRLLRNRFGLADDVPKRLPESFPLVLTSTVTDGALHIGVIHDGRYGDAAVEALADEVVRAFTELAQ